MSISDELKANILRYHHVEKWRVGTISRQLNVHHSTIKRVLAETGVPKRSILVQSSMIEPFVPFILDILQKYPTLTARRLYEMVKERGYPGGPDHFRQLISFYRPKKSGEAYLRLRTLPGEQAQVDWGHFGYMTVGKAKRPLMAFVMVLSYSRKIYLHFYLNARMESFLDGHEKAFKAFSGVPRVLLYDNLRSAVLERQGDAIRFNPTLLSFAAHYRFEPRPVAVARGNEKGRVERSIRYVRDNFFAARMYRDIDDLNEQARVWCDGQASDRPCPEERSQSVRKVFQDEQSRLITLPDNPYPSHETQSVRVGKTPYVRFDWNDYSVPHQHVNCTLTVIATHTLVTITNGTNVLAQHHRSYDKAQQIELNEHVEELLAQKKKAGLHRSQNRLIHATSSAKAFLNQAAKRGYPLRSTTSQLIQLLDDYGAALLDEAMAEALARDVPHPNAVRLSLQRLLDERELSPQISIDLSKNKQINELVVKPHALGSYDVLHRSHEEEE